MKESLVIGLDSSTQSTKAIAWDINGNNVAEGRADIPMQNPHLNFFEQNPDDWWSSCLTALRACMKNIDASRVQGLAISNQRETIGFFDKQGHPTHPAIVWLDGRSGGQVKKFSEDFGSEKIHRITGRPADMTPALYKMLWMKENKEEIYNSTDYFVDVQSFLVKKLCGGGFRTGWISADPMGFFDLEKLNWSDEVLEELDIDVSRLPDIHPPGTILGKVSEEVANLTGLPKDLAVYAAGGDGQLAGLGVNCTVSDRAYVNLGTAVVFGIWSPNYQYDTAWRTELAAQGEGYIYEGCLRSGAFLVDWFVDQFVAKGVKANDEDFSRLEQLALKIPIGSEGLLLQPYFSGSMNPHWDANARGVLLGLSAGHTEGHIYRAIIEGITLDLVMGTFQLEKAANQTISHYVAIGGGANSPLWRQMLADASGKPVHVSHTVEASALGAGMIAAYGAGWFSSITEAANKMVGATDAVLPRTDKQFIYGELIDIYKDLYKATASLNHRMVSFTEKQNR